MRLGLSSSLAHNGARDWAAKQSSLGCRSVVFPLTYEASDADISDYVSAAGDYDLTIAEVGIWKNVFALNTQEREAARRFAVGQLHLADAIGARCCVNIAGTFGGPQWDGGYRENFSRECWDMTVEYVQNLIDEVRPSRTEFSLEPMPWMIPTGPDEYLRLIQDIDREAFGVHLDVVNMINCPERYFNSDDFLEECFDKLAGLIRSCHVKNIRLEPTLTFKLQETGVADGSLNLRHYLELADKEDSDMPLIIEHLTTDEEYILALRYVRSLLG